MDLVLNMLAESVKRYLLPGSLPLLLILVTIAVGWWYLNERRQDWLRIGLTVVVLSYWLLALPLTSSLLEQGLSAGQQPATAAEKAEAVVVLGGGASVLRVENYEAAVLSTASARRALEGARLYHLMAPQWVIVSGGLGRDPQVPESEPLRQALLEQGVPAEVILMESGSSDTHDQAVLLKDLLARRGIDSFVLVTSPSHVRRAMGAFKAVGLEPLMSPAAGTGEGGQGGTFPLLPSMEALQDSVTSTREYLAIAYYWLRGWY
jgi:uncharacterized SAM-binding protein YcdF (DUF218 family)